MCALKVAEVQVLASLEIGVCPWSLAGWVEGDCDNVGGGVEFASRVLGGQRMRGAVGRHCDMSVVVVVMLQGRARRAMSRSKERRWDGLLTMHGHTYVRACGEGT